MFLAACGGTSAATPPPAPPVPSATFTMTAQNGSGVSGTGAIYKEVGAFRVSVLLTGLVPNSSHASHVHLGSCAAQGAVAYALLVVVADSSRGQGDHRAIDIEIDPGAAFTFQVDQLYQRGCRPGGCRQTHPARHPTTLHQSAAQQLLPGSPAIFEIGRSQCAGDRLSLGHVIHNARPRSAHSVSQSMSICNLPP